MHVSILMWGDAVSVALFTQGGTEEEGVSLPQILVEMEEEMEETEKTFLLRTYEVPGGGISIIATI